MESNTNPPDLADRDAAPPAPEPRLLGVSSTQYAAVQAGLAEDHPLDLLLASAGVHPDVYPRAARAWADLLAKELEHEATPLNETYEARFAEAQERLGPRIEPLADDLGAWLGFVRCLVTDPEPAAVLARCGLRPADLIRLQRTWARRIQGSPALLDQARRALEEATGSPPQVVIEPAPLARLTAPEPARFIDLDLDLPEEDRDDDLDDDDVPPVEDDAPPLFAILDERSGEVVAAGIAPGPAALTGPSLLHELPDATEPTLSVPMAELLRALLPFANAEARTDEARTDEARTDEEPPTLVPGSSPIEDTLPVQRSQLLRAALPFANAGSRADEEPPTLVPGPSSIEDTLPVQRSQVLRAALPFANAESRKDKASLTVTIEPSPALIVGFPFTRTGAQAEEASPAEPPASAPASASAASALTLDQYASLCAELAVSPAQSEAIFHRYGLAVVRDRYSVDLAWQARLRRSPARYREWQELYQRYYAQLAARSR